MMNFLSKELLSLCSFHSRISFYARIGLFFNLWSSSCIIKVFSAAFFVLIPPHIHSISRRCSTIPIPPIMPHHSLVLRVQCNVNLCLLASNEDLSLSGMNWNDKKHKYRLYSTLLLVVVFPCFILSVFFSNMCSLCLFVFCVYKICPNPLCPNVVLLFIGWLKCTLFRCCMVLFTVILSEQWRTLNSLNLLISFFHHSFSLANEYCLIPSYRKCTWYYYNSRILSPWKKKQS